jgi:hypothetical protein
MYTLLDTCVDRLDIFEFLSHVQDGLKDHFDIKILTYLMVARYVSINYFFINVPMMTKSLLKATLTRYLRDWLLQNFFFFSPSFS